MGVNQDSIPRSQMVFDHQAAQTIQEPAGSQGAAEMVVLTGPQFTHAGDGCGTLLVEGFAALFDDRRGEVPCIADLAVEQGFGCLVIGQWRFHPARERGDAVGAFPHEGEERI